MDKRFLSIVAAVILIFLGIVIFNRKDASAPTSGTSNASASNHVKGENAKKVTLVEYGDFQCPACAQYEPTVKEVYEKYQKDIQFQFRHFPLQSIHENALAGSRAAEAAGKQGKFWEMHDLLYANQTAWARSATPQTFYDQYAQSIGLNMDQYKKDFASNETNDVIKADLAEGTKLKVDSTPTFYLDGKKLESSQLSKDGSPSLEAFSKVIDDAINAKQ